MNNSLKTIFYDFTGKIVGYLPDLFAAIVLIGIGWGIGWIAKRIVIQICVILRLERFLQKFRWGKDLSKADVRFGLFNFIGNVVFVVIFLSFLSDALEVMKITFLSNLLERAISFFPKLVVALFVFGAGWFISLRVSSAIKKALLKEKIPRATLVARFTKTMVILFFSAIALEEMNISREIVIIGFTVTFITIGVLAVLIIALGGKELAKKILESQDEK